MPRSYVSSTIGVLTSTTVDGDGVSSTSAPTFVRSGSKSLTRSDVIKRVRGASGWRDPTDYAVSDDVIDGFSGRWITTRRYPPGYPARYDFVQTREGTLDGVLVSAAEYLANDMTLPSSNLENRSLIEALIKVRDAKINLAQAFAERKQTADLMATAVSRVMKAYSEVRRGKISKAFQTLGVRPRRLSKDTASRWLELQYGWLPLLSDIHGGYEEITRPRKEPSNRFKVVRNISETTEKSEVKEVRYSNIKIKVQSRSVKTVKSVLWFEVDNPALLAASQVGLLNPMTIAWELTPWSFVIDWMLPVGNILEAMTATAGTRFVSGTVTKTVKSTCTGEILDWVDNVGYVDTHNVSAFASRSQFFMNRSVLRYQPVVGPQHIYVKNPFSTTHVANALALLRGRIR